MKLPCIAVACLALAGLSGCGDDSGNNNNNNVDPCAEVTCGEHAYCYDYLGIGTCACDDGFQGNPYTGCAMSCTADSCSGHGTCDDSTGVTVCSCDEGWGGAACETCDTDYDLVEGSCVNSQVVDCADVTLPDNAHQLESLVTITFTTAGGWTAPTDCEWACNTDHDLQNGQCLHTREVDCVDITPPAHAHQVDALVTITYTDTWGWTSPADCEWACDTDFDLVDGACIDSQQVDCADISPPANAHQVESQVTITFTTAGGWTTPADCQWACDTDFDLLAGACIDSQQVDCADITPPANAHQVEAQVTITYTTAGGWTDPADCAYECDLDYFLFMGVCINSAEVDCNPITPPANAHQVDSLVTITYTTAEGWSTPADCGWECDTDYDLLAGACINSQLVDCTPITPPANAHMLEGQVTITYTSSGGWSAPADCDWECDTGWHREVDTCVTNVSIEWCNVQSPAPGYTKTIKFTETIYGQLWSTSGAGTAAAGALPGVLARFCYSTTAPVAPVNLSAMTCVDPTFNVDVGNNDEYAYDLRLDTPGLRYYLFAFSGDGGDTWTVCDTNGVSTSSVTPGEADITPVIANGGIELWDVGDVSPLDWTADTGVGVAKETTLVHSGSASVKLTRNSTDNNVTDFTSDPGPVVPGLSYTISMWFYDDNVDGRGRLIYQWLDASFALVGTTVYGSYTNNSTSWQNFTTTATAPSGAAYIQVITRAYQQTGGATTGGFIYLDDVSVY